MRTSLPTKRLTVRLKCAVSVLSPLRGRRVIAVAARRIRATATTPDRPDTRPNTLIAPPAGRARTRRRARPGSRRRRRTRAGAHDVAEDLGVRTHRSDQPLDLVALVAKKGEHLPEVAQGRTELGLVLADHAGEVTGELGGVDEQRVDRLSPGAEL